MSEPTIGLVVVWMSKKLSEELTCAKRSDIVEASVHRLFGNPENATPVPTNFVDAGSTW
ncbi:MAG: hypothetical protein ACK5PZ_18120 [Pirellula sp.]